jgi:hypothetical protein
VLTPEQRTTRARLAAYAQWAAEPDRTARTKPKRDAFMARFEREARAQCPDASDDAIVKMAEAKKRAYFTKLAFRSSRARAARKQGTNDGGAT